jgi:hypothetical protein
VSRAQQELFNAMHMQLLRGTSLLARLLLVGVVLEGRATGRGQVLLQVRGGDAAVLRGAWRRPGNLHCPSKLSFERAGLLVQGSPP